MSKRNEVNKNEIIVTSIYCVVKSTLTERKACRMYDSLANRSGPLAEFDLALYLSAKEQYLDKTSRNLRQTLSNRLRAWKLGL